MLTIVALAAELITVLAVISGIQFLVLVFRNPHRAQWLRISVVETFAVLGIVVAITLSTAFLVTGLIAAGVNVFAAIALAFALPLIAGYANHRVFGIGSRLARADAGASPFITPSAPAAVHPSAPHGNT